MRDLAILFIHLLTTIARLMRSGAGSAVVAESLLVKHQLVILNRGRERAPNLRPMDRIIAGLCTLFIRPGRLLRIAVVLKPSSLLAFHAALVKRKYRQLFSPKRRGKPGPKGPSPELIAAIVETKIRNPSWGHTPGDSGDDWRGDSDGWRAIPDVRRRSIRGIGTIRGQRIRITRPVCHGARRANMFWDSLFPVESGHSNRDFRIG